VAAGDVLQFLSASFEGASRASEGGGRCAPPGPYGPTIARRGPALRAGENPYQKKPEVGPTIRANLARFLFGSYTAQAGNPHHTAVVETVGGPTRACPARKRVYASHD
jgi:hypothetical protein